VVSGIRKPLGLQDLRAPPGARTTIGVQGSGWVPGAGTRKLLDPVALP
jgi:hypothetical protein